MADAYNTALDESVPAKAAGYAGTAAKVPFAALMSFLSRFTDPIASSTASTMNLRNPDPYANRRAADANLENVVGATTAPFKRAAGSVADTAKGAFDSLREGAKSRFGWEENAPPQSVAAADRALKSPGVAPPIPTSSVVPGALVPGMPRDTPQSGLSADPDGVSQGPRPSKFQGDPAQLYAEADAIPNDRDRAGVLAALAKSGIVRPTTAVASGGAFGGGDSNLVFDQAETPQGAFGEAQPAAAPRKTLPEIYTELMAKTNPKVNAELSPEQQAAARHMYFAKLLAAPNRPPGTVGGENPFGSAAVASQEYADKQSAINRGMEAARIGQERGDVVNLTGLSDKEADNVRLEKKQATDEQHQRKLEQLKEKELRLTAQYHAGIIDQRTYETEMRANTRAAEQAVKEAREGAKDPMERRFEFLQRQYPNESTDETMARVSRSMGGDKADAKDELALRSDYAKERRDHMKDPLNMGKPFPSFEQWRAEIEGKGSSNGKPATESDALKQARDAISKGAPKAEVNKRLQSWGYKTI